MGYYMFLIIDILIFLCVLAISGYVRYYLCSSVKHLMNCDYKPSAELGVLISGSLLIYKLIKYE